ncbi:MAG: hypothetical protein MRERV_25c020 [Mycoplasmataceae bacterium RV_VA103A]|nr:MAG: hypothetical protein MRERV_25c020 [Mycoplasmataceae bacterium RV_VA103A]
MSKKYNKYSQEWLNEIKRLIPKKNITEKDKDGKVIDKPEIEILGEKRIELDNQIQTLAEEIRTGKSRTEKAQSIYKSYKYLKRKRNDWQTHLTTNISTKTYNYQNLSDNFRNDDAYGWNKKIKDHFEKEIQVGTIHYANNLYELNLPDTVKQEIVEEEIITILGKIFEGLEKIEIAKFCAKYNVFDNNTTNQGRIKTWLENIQKEAKLLIKNGDKMYDFSYSYRIHSTDNTNGNLRNNGAGYNSRPVQVVVKEFFDWLTLVNKEDFLKTLTDDITNSQNISIRLKGVKIDAQKLKEDYGIPLKSDQSIYSNGNSSTTYCVKGGIKGWIKLAEAIGNAGNRAKLISSFDNAPNHELFDSMGNSLRSTTPANAWNEDEKSWHDGTRHVGLEAMPKSIARAEEVLDELKVLKDIEVKDVVLSNHELAKKQIEKSQKETERSSLDSKMQKMITDELTNKRTTLTTYKITDGFELTRKADGTADQDNRRTSSELMTIKEKLEEIRYLENADTAISSSNDDENTAYSKLEELINDFQQSKIFKFITVEGTTNADKCKKIKETTNDLQAYHDDYEKWEKLIKFTETEKQALGAIKIALGQKEDPTDTLTTYQSKLKTLDPLLDETVITQSLIDDWKTQNNFKTATTMENLIKKVLPNGKLDDKFKEVMTKKDAELTDLAKLFKKKKAKEIITLIKRWEYDSDTADNQDKVDKIIKMNMGKSKSDILSEEQITTGLYKLAVGEYSQKTEAEIKSWEGGTENNQKPEEKFFRINNPLMWGGIGVIAVIVAAAIYYFLRESQKGEKTEEELVEKVEGEEDDQK